MSLQSVSSWLRKSVVESDYRMYLDSSDSAAPRDGGRVSRVQASSRLPCCRQCMVSRIGGAIPSIVDFLALFSFTRAILHNEVRGFNLLFNVRFSKHHVRTSIQTRMRSNRSDFSLTASSIQRSGTLRRRLGSEGGMHSGIFIHPYLKAKPSLIFIIIDSAPGATWPSRPSGSPSRPFSPRSISSRPSMRMVESSSRRMSIFRA